MDREVGAKPTRSRHCKRRDSVNTSLCWRPVKGAPQREDRPNRQRLREPGDLPSGARSSLGAKDADWMMSLSAQHISYSHGRPDFALRPGFSLRDVSLSIPRQSLTGLLGPNGCGKTTLLKLLAGVLQPDRG